MDRVVKFRGLRTDGKGWVYGFFVQPPIGKCRIYWHPFKEATSNTWHEVTLETVGQFTGLTDSNGKEIYEGDLVNYRTIVKTDETGENITYKGEIQFWLGQAGCGWRYKSGGYTLMMKRSHAWSMEVIGNIHEKTNKND